LGCVAVGAGDAGDSNTTGVTNAKEAKPPEVVGFDSVVPNPVDFCDCDVLIELAGALANPPAIGLDVVVIMRYGVLGRQISIRKIYSWKISLMERWGSDASPLMG